MALTAKKSAVQQQSGNIIIIIKGQTGWLRLCLENLLRPENLKPIINLFSSDAACSVTRQTHYLST